MQCRFHHATRADPVKSAFSTLCHPQGSLAELRVEVATATRLSSNASAAVADYSPGARPSLRSSSVSHKQRMEYHSAGTVSPLRQRSALLTPTTYKPLAGVGPTWGTCPLRCDRSDHAHCCACFNCSFRPQNHLSGIQSDLD